MNLKFYYEHVSKRVQPKKVQKVPLKKAFAKIPENYALAQRRLLYLKT